VSEFTVKPAFHSTDIDTDSPDILATILARMSVSWNVAFTMHRRNHLMGPVGRVPSNFCDCHFLLSSPYVTCRDAPTNRPGSQGKLLDLRGEGWMQKQSWRNSGGAINYDRRERWEGREKGTFQPWLPSMVGCYRESRHVHITYLISSHLNFVEIR